MDYFTRLFPYEQFNFKSNKSNYCFQNKMAHKKIYKQTNLKKGFKTASKRQKVVLILRLTKAIKSTTRYKISNARS